MELLNLWNIIDEFDGDLRNLLTVIFSSILKSCSSQTNHWGYVADNMKPRSKVYRDAIKLFLSSFQDFIDSSTEFVENQAKNNISADALNGRALIIRSDLRMAPPLTENLVDLVVTSPPYINVTDYTTSQRLSLDWFGQDVSKMKSSEIGARWKRFRQGCTKEYSDDMSRCLSHICISLKHGGFLCIIIDSSEDRHGMNVVDFIKNSLLAKSEFILFEEVRRNRSRQRLRRKDGSSCQELIIVFQKL